MSILEEEFARMYTLFSRRLAFHSLNQVYNESKRDWINKLRRLGDQSKIQKMTPYDIYVLRIVQGTCDSKFKVISKRKNPSLDEVIEMAKSYEIVKNSVSASNGNLRAMKTTSSNYKDDPCKCCGRKGHTRDKCQFKDAECHHCVKKGHIKPACLQLKREGEQKKSQ